MKPPQIKKSLILHEKKFIVSLSILSILAVVGLFNRGIFSNTQEIAANESSSRQPANFSLGTTNLEDSVAKELSLKSLDRNAQLGQDPSKVEQLTFGVLEGKYAVRLKDGKLNALDFSPTSDQPKLLPNLEKFISENKEILPDFQSIQRMQNIQGNQENVQKFGLMSAAQRQMAEVEFHLDSLGRLISMKINNHL